MQGLVGITRIYLKHAAILLATCLLFQSAALHSDAQDKPKRPRITGIDRVRLYVTNIDRSRAFYTRVLGPHFSGGSCSGGTLPCFPVNPSQQVELLVAASPTPKNWLAEIGFATDDVSQLRTFLLAHGVAAGTISNDKSPYDKHPVNAHFEVLDPEGNPISFIQRFEASINDFVPIVQILHAGFVVKSTEAENRFYVDLLGFKLYWYGGFKDDGVDWYELQVPDGDNWIEYMLNIPPSADHKQLGAQNHFSFGVKEVEAAAMRLRKNGVQKIAGPGIGRDGKRGLNVYDPDDTRVEVTEFTPAREPCCHPYTAPHPTP